MVYGKSPSTTAPVPPTGMSTELAVGGWLLAVGALGGGASRAFFADLPNGDAATGFTTAFGVSTTGGAFGCGTGVAAAASAAGAGAAAAGILANLICITSTLCSGVRRSAANTAAAVTAPCSSSESATPPPAPRSSALRWASTSPTASRIDLPRLRHHAQLLHPRPIHHVE